MAGKTGLKAKWRHLADLPRSGERHPHHCTPLPYAPSNFQLRREGARGCTFGGNTLTPALGWMKQRHVKMRCKTREDLISHECQGSSHSSCVRLRVSGHLEIFRSRLVDEGGHQPWRCAQPQKVLRAESNGIKTTGGKPKDILIWNSSVKWINIDREFQHVAHNSEIQLSESPGCSPQSFGL